jgi:hypothetical protein
MTGIAKGLTEIESIALGSTPIVKVSLGDELVWPSTPQVEYHYGIWNPTADLDSGIIVAPAWATRVSVCLVGPGGSAFGGGAGGGGGVVWRNLNVVGGTTTLQITGTTAQRRIFCLVGGNIRATAFPGGNGSGNTGGAGGIGTTTGTVTNSTAGMSTGGAGGSIFSGGQAGGGGASGNYLDGSTGALGIAGGNGATASSGANGGGGGGGSALTGVTAGRGGRMAPFGQGVSGQGGAYANNGGDGSLVTGLGAAIFGGGGAGGFTSSVPLQGCWALRFHNGSFDYPLQVIPT